MMKENRHSNYKKQKTNRCFILYILLATLILLFPFPSKLVAASNKTYTVKPADSPYKNNYKKNATYNNKTKQYYLLRSYLEQLEKDGGGTLVLKKGKYIVTNTLYVPSNVEIVLQDGVKLVKGNDTGSKKLSPSKSMFQLIAPSKATRSSAAAKYKGEAEISFIGEGTATIDLNYVKNAEGIVLGHNSNITIKGIVFQNMYSGNMIKIGASKDVAIQNNTFKNHKDSDSKDRAAISIEIPDSVTKAFSYTWSKNDKTINNNISIMNNTFTKLERAISTTKYSEDLYNKNINIVDNDISAMDSHAIRVLNWDKFTIEGNDFTGISNGAKNMRAIILNGAKAPTIKQNTFTKVDRAIQIYPWKNSGSGSQYEITYNNISNKSKDDMLDNTLIEMGEYFIRYNMTFNEFEKDTEKWDIYDMSVEDFVINPNSDTFKNMFITYSTYTNKTKQYYVIRSYLEQLEKLGGGTLTLEAGVYNITNSLYVPSNVTIILRDGVIINKTEDTGTKDMTGAKSLFVLASPSNAIIEDVYGKYDGDHNIKIIGEGKAIIDLKFVKDALGIVMGHNKDITISGITFQNMFSGHFIELDASLNVIVENNIFQNYKASSSGIKEAINVDTPDPTTGGFSHIWTKHDCTPNKDIYIRNNIFDNLERAIGTHKYSGGKYHENVQIIDNIISNIGTDAIRIMNWSKPVIKGNEIRMVNKGGNGDRAILASGVIHPIITDNIFEDVAKPIQIMPWKNNGLGEQYDITYNQVGYEDFNLMQKNTLIRVGESFIRYNKTYNVFDRDTEKYYIY